MLVGQAGFEPPPKRLYAVHSAAELLARNLLADTMDNSGYTSGLIIELKGHSLHAPAKLEHSPPGVLFLFTLIGFFLVRDIMHEPA